MSSTVGWLFYELHPLRLDPRIQKSCQEGDVDRGKDDRLKETRSDSV